MILSRTHFKFWSIVAVGVAIIFSLSGLLPTTLVASPDENKAVVAKKELSETERKKKIQLSFDDTLATIGVAQAARSQIKTAGIVSFSELRRKALIRDPKLITSLSDDAWKKVHRTSLISLFSQDPKLIVEMAKQNINSLGDFVKLTPTKIRSYSGGRLNLEGAKTFHKKAVALKQFAAFQAGVMAGISRSLYFSSTFSPYLNNFHLQLEQCAPSGSGGHAPPSPAAPVCPGNCDGLTDAFSPSVYLIYLLDFLEKSFGDKLDTLGEIDSRFYQKFENVPVSAGADQVDTYVKYSNDILINLIAELYNMDWKTETQHATAEATILNDFNGASKFILEIEPQADTGVLIKLFDSYLKEMGVDRRDAQFALSLSLSYKQKFANDHKLTLLELATIGRINEQIDLAAINSLRDCTPAGAPTVDGKDVLYRWNLRKIRKTVEQEFIADIQDQLRIGFSRWFSSYKANRVDAVFKELYNQYPSGSLSDEQMLALREQAKSCVSLGLECPSSNEYLGQPLTPLRGLYIYHFVQKNRNGMPKVDQVSKDVDQATKDLVQAELVRLHEEFVAERHRQLVADECGTDIECCKTLIQVTGTPPCTDCENCRAQKNEQKAQSYAQERLISEDEFENQLSVIATGLFNENDDFRAEVIRRAEEAWRLSISRAEAGFHTKIRANLIAIMLHKLQALQPPSCDLQLTASTAWKYPCVTGATDTPLLISQNIQRLADYLFLDLEVSEDYRTTPLAAAISRIHTFIQAVRLGKLPEAASIDANNFNKDVWSWLQSYGIWHAAMMVTAYPEDFLMPPVRRTATSQFESVSRLEDLNADELTSAYLRSIDRLSWMNVIGTARVGNRTLVFAKSCFRPGIFYGIVEADGSWRNWREVLGAAGTQYGYKLYAIIVSDNYVFLFRLIDHPNPEFTWMFQVGYLSFKVNDDGSLDQGTEEGGEPSSSTEESWKDLIDPFKISGHGYLHFAVSNPKAYFEQGRIYTHSSIIILNASTKQIKYQSVVLENGGALIPSEPTAPNPPVYGKTNNDFQAATHTRGIHGVQGMPNLMLWNMDGELRFVDATSFMDGNTGSLIGDVPNLNKDDGFGAVKTESETFLYFNVDQIVADETGHLSNVNRCIIKRLSPSPTSWLISVPEQQMEANGIAIPDTGPVIFVKSTDSLNQWKQYIASVSSCRNLSLSPWWPLQVGSASLSELYAAIGKQDISRIYLDEYYLYLPILIAERLNEAGRYEEAMACLSKVYDPMARNETSRRKYPGFNESTISKSELGKWLHDPFNPYSLADLNPEIYLFAVKLAHVQNLLDWADKLFTQDSTESVNRARELYELAASILELANLPGQCTIDFSKLVSTNLAASMNVQQTFRLNAALRAFNKMAIMPSINEVRSVLNSGRSLEAKIVSIESIAVANQAKTTIKKIIESRELRIPCSNALEEQALAGVSEKSLEGLAEGLYGVTIGPEFVGVDLRFCIPQNPLVKLLRWRIESNLAKISQNRNYAGLSRQLEPYATPIDPTKVVKAAAAGNLDFEELAATLSQPPPIYRYTYLVERAKQLAQTAQQFQNSMFVSIKEGEEADYQIMKARQDMQLERANVSLQTLRVREASNGKALALLQQARSTDELNELEKWIEEGISNLEAAAIGFTIAAGTAKAAAAGFAAETWYERTAAIAGEAFSTTAQVLSTYATYDRRYEEWELRRKLAKRDQDIAGAGITLADDRIDIANKERDIADLRLENANDTIEFLQDRFFNKALYNWMKRNLKHLYREQLNLAISTAKAAQHALEFDRQTSLDFINYDYWDDDKQGILGSERLVADIEKMDAYRLDTATRKREIEKTISLASNMPIEFQQFRKKGVFDFGTIMPWFDRDFPGHYMRLIRDVNLTVLALVPPNEGIHATLSNNGLSRVMVGAPFEQATTIHRLPESIALSSAYKATGLFELRPESDPMLLPFEGNGVDTTWRLEMPKGANRFNYDTLYDVLFTIRYTALEDRDYRTKVLEAMGQNDEGYVKTGGVRYFSLRNDFPDQWYYLFNPVVDLADDQYWDPSKGDGTQPTTDEGKPQRPYTFVFDLKESDFVPNESRHQIKKITLAIQTVDQPFGAIEENWSLPITTKLRRIPSTGSIELTEESYLRVIDGIAGNPFGTWSLSLGKKSETTTTFPAPATEDFVTELKNHVQDIWLIIEYTSYAHYNKQ